MKNPFVIVHHFPGGTKAQYKAVLAAVHPSLTTLPPGQLSHFGGPSAGGWTIVAVHDSRASWLRFRNRTLLPALKKGIAGGFASPPQEYTFTAATALP